MQINYRQRGMTLIELMVSMVIGMFLVLGAVTVYTQGRQNYQANEGISRLQENIRFALDLIEPDIRLAGFWGMHSSPGAITSAGMNITCDGANVNAWALNPAGGPVGLRAINNIQAGAAGQVANNCPAFAGGIVVNTDVLEVRRASAQPALPAAGQTQVQSNPDGSAMFNNGNIPAAYTDVNPLQMNTFNVVLNSWYVANRSNSFANVPSLRRRTLRGGVMVDEEVIAGVENMQIQLGIDTDATPDGNVDRYVDPNDPLVATSSVLSVRLWLLMRSADTELGFIDGATYTPLDSVLGNFAPNDGFRRMQVSKTIFLRNSRQG